MSVPVVVTAPAFASAFNESAFENAEEHLADLGDPVERAAFLAALPGAFRAVSDEAATVDHGLLFAPTHPLASRLMSAIADQAPAGSTFEPLAAGGLELQFATNDWWGWFRSLFDWVCRNRHHPIVRPVDDKPTVIADTCRIAVLGDWGTGLYGAPAIAAQVRAMGPFDAVLHLGDVYYSGTEKEIRDRFLADWPFDAAPLHRAMNSNHEMYSGGFAYFDVTLPRFQQTSSYFALANSHWLVLGLDTGHRDHDVDADQAAWVRRMVQQAGGRKVILMSHHQLSSRFGSQGSKLAASLGPVLNEGLVTAWYWGHEHRCLIYEPDPRFGGMLARCIGHSGMPERRTAFAKLPITRREGGAIWRAFAAGNGVPGGLALDGENPYIKDKERDYAPHGFAVLELSGPHLSEAVLLPDGQEVYRAELF